jgi:protocatechuate 3,4-dioxygenase, alpha subunit
MTDTSTKKPAGITPSATVGPFFAYGLTPLGRYPWKDTGTPRVAPPGTDGVEIRIEGRVLDGDGAGIPDALLEVWQADAQGRFNAQAGKTGANAQFIGWGRADTDKDGGYHVETIKPGAVPAPTSGQQAPHLLIAVFARGMLRHLYTRIYFAEDNAAHAADPILAQVPAARRKTLMAAKGADGVYRFDIRIQGGDETVFFDY